MPVEAIVDQATSIRPCTAYVNRTNKKHDTSPGTSCPDAIGRALKDLYERNIERISIPTEMPAAGEWEDAPDTPFPMYFIEENSDLQCPDCGAHMAMEGGCIVCKMCGYSKCD